MNQQQINLVNDGIALADVESPYRNIHNYVISPKDYNLPLETSQWEQNVSSLDADN